MPPLYFPLRWESTGDQWWYASPIDWAAANGHYELVRELLRLDSNHLIKLTSLRRIRRLETVWDNEDHFDDVAFNRSRVAHKLFLECESKKGGKNSLLRTGYGGWLLYTAASAGDLGFVKELLEKDPLLVFGEGEFGVTDVLYAAAKSKKYEVFKVIFDFAASPRFMSGDGKELVERIGEVPSGYKWEMMNRGVHAAARGGNLRILKDLLDDSYDILAYRDNQGSTVLHAAAGRGQVQVVKHLVESYDDIINSTDKQGNRALHVAAYRGQLVVVEALIQAFPSSVHSKNNSGETFLHKAITGFQTPSFRRLDRQIQLMKQLVYSNTFSIDEIINATNNEDRTALHLAIIGNIHSDLVEILTSIRSIDVNIRDMNGMTPLDLIKERPNSSSSEILTRQLISAGGIFTCHDYSSRKIIASHLRRQSIGSSPGTSFRISDARLFLYTGIEYNSDGAVSSLTDESMELSQPVRSPRKSNRLSSVNYAAERLKRLINWPKMKHRKSNRMKKLLDTKKAPISLRERYSNSNSKPSSSIASNKRTLAVRSNLSSPTAKKMKTTGSGLLMKMQRRSRSSSFSRSSASSWDTNLGIFTGQSFDVEGTTKDEENHKSVKKKLIMNRYLCFGSSTGPTTKPAHHI